MTCRAKFANIRNNYNAEGIIKIWCQIRRLGKQRTRYDTTPERVRDLPHRERKRIETEITQIRPDPGSGINLIMSIRDLRNKYHCIGQQTIQDGFKQLEYIDNLEF